MRERIQVLVNETLADAQGKDVGEDMLLDLIDSGRSEGGLKASLTQSGSNLVMHLNEPFKLGLGCILS